MTSLLAETPAEADYSATIRRVAEALVARSRKTYVLPSDVAFFFAFANDRDRCLEWLERAYQVRDPNMVYLGDPLFYDLLGSDPRYQDLLRRMGLPNSVTGGSMR